jgi:choline-sulfatase
MADQLSPYAVPGYGNAVVQAPHLAALGTSGVVFENAYCNSPLCAPSRASMMTGRLPSRIGVYDNGAELAASLPTIAHYLRAAGFRTCLAGKMHFVGPDQLHGFEERLTTDLYPAGLDWTPDWDRPPGDRLPWYHDMSSVLEAGVSQATLQADFDEEVAFRAVRAITGRSSWSRPSPIPTIHGRSRPSTGIGTRAWTSTCPRSLGYLRTVWTPTAGGCGRCAGSRAW